MQAFRAYWDRQDRQPTYQDFRDFMSFWSMYGGSASTAQPPAPAPVQMQSVPLVTAEDSRTTQSMFLSKLLKEARQLGCGSFDGTSDALVAKEWLKRVIATFDDMVLDEVLRLKVATRLLEGIARVWWESLRGRSHVALTWPDFQNEFDEEYYTRFHRDQKRQEFMQLSQGSRSVTEYETELKDLANFVPELVGSEKILCSKFEAGLNLSVRERMAVAGNQSFNEIVQLALRAEKLVLEGRRVRESISKRKSAEMSQPSKKSKGESSSPGAPSVGFFRVPQSKSSGQQSSVPSGSVSGTGFAGTKRQCWNCHRFHNGCCSEPRRCFQCGQEGHIKSACPELVRGDPTVALVAGSSGQTKGSQPIRSVAASNMPQQGGPQSLTISQTRIFALTNEEPECGPSMFAGMVPILCVLLLLCAWLFARRVVLEAGLLSLSS
ncbi:Retroviral ribonuclease H protein [Dioscorea alata]|uniref:Retroviral ribonuclease H protein n=1 Tax=Dioscorea alata TaxID=55571 RepID=A0ACB7WTG5_DIOAL|nr:Retroviral ribonuclease H protein [Dioscorea alata]